MLPSFVLELIAVSRHWWQ